MKRGVVMFAVALGITLVVATVVAQFSSTEPDGLEFVAEEEGFAATADANPADSPLADYGGDGARNVAVAGLIGVVVTLLIGLGVFWLVRVGKDDRAVGT